MGDVGDNDESNNLFVGLVPVPVIIESFSKPKLYMCSRGVWLNIFLNFGWSSNSYSVGSSSYVVVYLQVLLPPFESLFVI